MKTVSLKIVMKAVYEFLFRLHFCVISSFGPSLDTGKKHEHVMCGFRNYRMLFSE